MSETKYTKADWLSATEFAKKHNLDPDSTTEIVRDLYKKGTLLSSKTPKPIVVRNRLVHRSKQDKYILINPEATEFILNKYKSKGQK